MELEGSGVPLVRLTIPRGIGRPPQVAWRVLCFSFLCGVALVSSGCLWVSGREQDYHQVCHACLGQPPRCGRTLLSLVVILESTLVTSAQGLLQPGESRGAVSIRLVGSSYGWCEGSVGLAASICPDAHHAPRAFPSGLTTPLNRTANANAGEYTRENLLHERI